MTTETTTFSNQVVALKRDLLADISRRLAQFRQDTGVDPCRLTVNVIETTHLKSTHREHRPISVDVDFNL
jgi:hypothetical protein